MTDVQNLEGAELDAAVARALGIDKPWGLSFGPDHPNRKMRGGLLIGRFSLEEALAKEKLGFVRYISHYSTGWALAGPIIERERINIEFLPDGGCYAECQDNPRGAGGDTPLIAAMRAFVAAKGQHD